MVLAFVFGDGAAGALAHPTAAPQPTGAVVNGQASWGRLGVALIAALYAYSGWQSVSYVAGEIRDPGRTYPRAVVAGLAIVVTMYLAANGAYLYVLTVDELSLSPLVAGDVIRRVVGSRVSAIVAALVMVSAFGTLTANVLTQPRLFYAMAEDGLFFRQLAVVHRRFDTPHVAIAFVAFTAIGLVAVRTWDQLRELLIVGVWPFIALAVLAVPVLRRHHPEIPRPYRTPGYPFVPLAFVAASLAVLGNIVVQHPGSTLASFGFTLLGIPVYMVRRAVHRRHAAV
ncbi:MAG TPA: amino acid permease [Gemmatimonadaceae bacterium]